MEILGRPIDGPAVEARIDALVARHARAGSGAMEVLNLIGGQAEGLLDRLPPEARARLGTVTERALLGAAEAAHGTRGSVPDLPQGRTRLLTTVMGAVGGAGGLDRNLVAFKATAGERVTVTPEGGAAAPAPVVVNIHTPDPRAFEAARGQVAADIARAVAKGQRRI